jgi:hypothetical protein
VHCYGNYSTGVSPSVSLGRATIDCLNKAISSSRHHSGDAPVANRRLGPCTLRSPVFLRRLGRQRDAGLDLREVFLRSHFARSIKGRSRSQLARRAQPAGPFIKVLEEAVDINSDRPRAEQAPQAISATFGWGESAGPSYRGWPWKPISATKRVARGTRDSDLPELHRSASHQETAIGQYVNC